jgi:hypothetical protein
MVCPWTVASTSAPLDFENAPLYRTLVKTLSATETTPRAAAAKSAKNILNNRSSQRGGGFPTRLIR